MRLTGPSAFSRFESGPSLLQGHQSHAMFKKTLRWPAAQLLSGPVFDGGRTNETSGDPVKRRQLTSITHPFVFFGICSGLLPRQEPFLLWS